MTAYTLFHDGTMMADSSNLVWVKDVAMAFHRSAYAARRGVSVFVLPRNI